MLLAEEYESESLSDWSCFRRFPGVGFALGLGFAGGDFLTIHNSKQ